MSAEIIIKGINFKSKDEVTLIYPEEGIVIHGAIYFNNNSDFWFCSNAPLFDGDKSPDRLGYSYSYHYNLSSINNDGGIFYHRIKVEKVKSKTEEYISNDIITFINTEIRKYKFLFLINNGLVENYDKLTKSTDNSIVIFHSSERNKKLEIKFGRLIRRMATSFAEIVAKNPKNTIPYAITDDTIEKIHNRFVSQNDKSLRHEIVSGKDIIKGYTKQNYCDGRGTLHNSCMTDKYDYLKLYTENSDKISLAIFYNNENKICGRALIWKADNGNTYFDRVYYTVDWQNNLINKTLTDLGFHSIYQSSNSASVKLSKIDFTAFPYLDTFFGISFKKKQLFFDPHGKKKIRYELRTTNGQVYERYNDNDLDFE
jgi:hypothetical protein